MHGEFLPFSCHRITIDDAEKFLAKFSKLDGDHDGKLDINDFARAMDLPPTDAVVVSLFERYDQGAHSEVHLCLCCVACYVSCFFFFSCHESYFFSHAFR